MDIMDTANVEDIIRVKTEQIITTLAVYVLNNKSKIINNRFTIKELEHYIKSHPAYNEFRRELSVLIPEKHFVRRLAILHSILISVIYDHMIFEFDEIEDDEAEDGYVSIIVGIQRVE